MPEILITTRMDTKQSDASFAQLEERINLLSSKKITITIDTTGVDKLSSKMLTVANTQAKAQIEAEKTAQSQAKVAAEVEKTRQAQLQVTAETEKTGQAIEKTAQAVQKTQQANTEVQTVEQKRLLLAEQMASVYDKLAIKAAQSSGLSSVGVVTNTPMQTQIEYLAKYQTLQQGISTEFVNSAQWADYFKTKGSTAFSDTTDAAKKTTEAVKKTGTEVENTGDKISTLITKVAKWAVATTLIYGPIRAFKAAADELKAVDDQLVEVRKVTTLNSDQLDALSEKAFKVGSTYGVAASDYLNNVAEFSRAGYQNLSAALGELSVKTQIVGDVNADVANQFLLSVDAAYKYNGSVSELSKVLDGANEIDNKYATSIEKIAEGLGKVAPIASQAHVGINELESAIGTITAVTQRSGTEAATALRALFLNILGDTKTEIADGATWTAGEIEGLRDVIKLYASDAYEAAEATGSVINPMEAIAGLAQSMKDGLLTEQQLMSMVSDIGGKLRTSQLLALIQNWDMYESMLTDYGNAAGSADKEVANALDSWTRKTEILKNTWTEFIQGTNFKELATSVIELGTKAIELLDNGATQAIIKGAALSTVIWGLSKAWAAIKVSNIAFMFECIRGGSVSAAEAVNILTTSMLANPFFDIALIGATVIGINSAIDSYKQKLQDAAEKSAEVATQATEEATTLADLQTQYLALSNIQNRTTEQENEFQTVVESITTALGDKATALEGLTAGTDAYTQALKNATAAELEKAAIDVNNSVDDAAKSLEASGTLPKYEWAQITSGGAGMTESLYSQIAGIFGADASSAQFSADMPKIRDAETLLDYYNKLVKAKALMDEESYKNADSTIKESDAYKDISNIIDELASSADTYSAALAKLNKADALSQVHNDLKTRNIDSQQAFDSYVSSIQNSTEYSEDFKAALLDVVNKAFPEYSGAADDATDSTNALGDSAVSTSSKLETLSTVGKSLSEVPKALKEFATDGKLSFSTLADLRDAFADSVPDIDTYVNKLADASLTADDMQSILGELTQKYIETKLATGEWTDADQDLIAKMLEENGVLNANEVASNLVAKSKAEVAVQSAIASGKIGDLVANLSSEAAQCGMTTVEFANLIAQEIIFNSTGLNVSDKIASLTLLAKSAGYASNMIASVFGTGASAKINNSVRMQTNKGTDTQTALNNAFNSAWSTIAGPDASSTTTTPVYGGGNSSSGGGGTEADALKEQSELFKEQIAVLEQKLYLQQQSKNTEVEQVETSREIQAQLKSQADWYRSQGLDDNSEYIRELQKQWWQYEKSIEDVYSGLRDDLVKAVDNLLDKQIDKLDALIDAENKRYNLIKDQNELKEKQLAIEKAQEALKNAENERTIWDVANRVWIADAEAVKKAQDDLVDAQKDLDDYNLEQAHEAIIQAYEDQKDALQKEWATIKESWEEPTSTIEEILSELASVTTPALKSQIEQITSFFGLLTGDTSSTSAGTKISSYQNDFDYQQRIDDIEAEKSNYDANGNLLQGAAEELKSLETARNAKIYSQGLEFKQTSNYGGTVYDSGGIAYGKGFMAKNVNEGEVVLPPDVARQILSPTSSTQFTDFVKSLNLMFDTADAASNMAYSKGGSSSVDSHNQSTYINGVKIGSDMLNKPLSATLSALGLHTEQ